MWVTTSSELIEGVSVVVDGGHHEESGDEECDCDGDNVSLLHVYKIIIRKSGW